MTAFHVTCGHDTHAQYRFDNEPVVVIEVKRYDYDTAAMIVDGYSADHPVMGMSKKYPTPAAAIRAILHDHGCTNVLIEEI